MKQIMFELFLKIETFSLGSIIYCSLIGLTVSNDLEVNHEYIKNPGNPDEYR
jgi:hypothetical protein